MRDEPDEPAVAAGGMSSIKAQLGPLGQLVRKGPTLNQSNLLFTGIPLGWAGVIGSAVSVMFGGAVLLAMLRLYQRKIRFPTDRGILAIAAAFAFYIAADVISALFNNHGWVTWREVVEDLPFIGFIFVYARLSFSRRADVLYMVELGAITGTFATAIVVTVELLTGNHSRAEGLAGNPGVLAVIASLAYGVCLIAAVRHNGRTRWVALMAALAAATILLLTGMRALWPFLLIGPIIPLAILRPALDWRAISKGALIAAAPLLLVAYLTHGMVQTRMDALVTGVEQAEAGNYSDSVGKRLVLWKYGLVRAFENPLVGTGPGTAKIETAESLGYSHYHNFLLNAMIRSGLVGVLALIGLFAVPLWVMVPMVRDPRTRDGESLAGLSLLVAMYATFLLSGSVGIMLGHDIHDTIFIYGTIVASFLVRGERTADLRIEAERETPPHA